MLYKKTICVFAASTLPSHCHGYWPPDSETGPAAKHTRILCVSLPPLSDLTYITLQARCLLSTESGEAIRVSDLRIGDL